MTTLERHLFAGSFPDGPGTMPLGPAALGPRKYDPAQLGARVFSIDPERSDPAAMTELGDPYVDAAYLALHPRLPVLYSVHRSPSGGAVAAWTIGHGSPATLKPVSIFDSQGAEPCHVTVSPDGRHLFVANYRGPTVASFVLTGDGTIAACADVVTHLGSGPNPGRQEAAHPHMALIDPVTGHLLVCDLGADRIFGYEVDSNGRLVARPESSAQLPAGAGPRHAAFVAEGRALLVVNELGSSVALLRRRAAGFQIAEVVSTVPRRSPRNGPSAIRISPDGSFAYVGNRGHDSVATLSIRPDGTSITLADLAPCGGSPRDLLVDSAHGRLLVANLTPGVVVSMALTSAGPPLSAESCWTVPNVSSLVLAEPSTEARTSSSPYNLR